MKEQVDESLKRLFNPEFLNRIDDTIVFRHLEKEDIKAIINISFKKLLKRVEQMGVNVDLSDEALDFLAEKGFDKIYGARPLRRALQKYVEDPIAEEILKGSVKEGTKVKVTLAANKGELLFGIEQTDNQVSPVSTIDEVIKDAAMQSNTPQEAPAPAEAEADKPKENKSGDNGTETATA
jgi:ATP-dependent Clp protease ATP-binding subunit ClpC